MKYLSIYLKESYGGGTQVLNKVSDTLGAKKIYLFKGSIKKSIRNILELKKEKQKIKLLSDPIAGIILFIFRINFVRFIQGKDTIYFDKNYNWIINSIYKFLYRLSFNQTVIYNSEFIKNWVSTNFKKTQLIGKISPGTDYKFYKLDKQYDYIYIFRKDGWKNTKMLINNIRSFTQNEKLLIINSDRLDLSFLKKNISCKIVIHDQFVSLQELNIFFSKSKFFISTTLDEGFGMPALEAMASGCLPIVPSIGGTSDFCIDKINSIMFTNNDNVSFEKALNFARDLDEKNYEMMVDKAHNRSLDFSWSNTADNTSFIKNKYFE